MSRTMRRVLVVAAVSAVVTLTVALVPAIHFAYRQPRLHVALETSAALVGLLAAFLLYGRLRRSHRLDEFLLTSALAVLALTNLTFAAIPASTDIESTTSTAWAAGLARGVGAILLVAAALVPARRITRERFVVARAGAAMVLFFGALAALAALLRHWLPEGVVEPPESNVSNPQLEGHPVLLGGQLVVAALYASAAVGFARRGEHRRDEFLAWFAIACVLAAFSRINYFLFPSLYSDWVYVGDVFRLLFYVVLLAAALREIGGYWESIRTAAALDERRQIAHDVHDGLAQELAYLERAVHLLDDPSTARDARERVEAAVGRAQTESRRLIHALTTRIDEPVEAVLTRVTAEAADRWGIGLELDLAEGLHADGARRDALLRIAAEAVTNVGKHSGARSARVELAAAGSRVRLIVSDDGCGFDSTERVAGRQSFGLVSMRERAAAVGGELSVSSDSGGGTTVEAIV